MDKQPRLVSDCLNPAQGCLEDWPQCRCLNRASSNQILTWKLLSTVQPQTVFKSSPVYCRLLVLCKLTSPHMPFSSKHDPKAPIDVASNVQLVPINSQSSQQRSTVGWCYYIHFTAKALRGLHLHKRVKSNLKYNTWNSLAIQHLGLCDFTA